MSATQAFADRWRRSGRSAATLVQISLNAGALPAVSVYAAHSLTSTPNGALHEPLLVDVEPISAPGVFGTSDIPLCSTRIKLNNRKVGSQAGSLASLMPGRSVIGSVVTIYLWETGLTQFSDALVVFKGVVQDYEATPDGVTLNLRQRTDWNRPMPSATMEPSIYPRAPEGGRGAPLPVVYGNVVGPGLRAPHTPAYSLAQRRLEMLRGPSNLSRGALVDTGRGGLAKAKVLAASHQVVNLFDAAAGTALWADMEGRMVLVNAQAGDVVNTATECGILVVDGQEALVMVNVAEVVTGVTNPARNSRYCLEPNDTTYAELDYNATLRDLQIRMGSMPDLGGMLGSATTIVLYEADSGTNLWLQGDTYGTPQQVALGATTVPTLATVAANLPATWGGFSDYVSRVYYGAAASSYVKVYFLGVLVTFRIERKVLVAGHKVSDPKYRPTRRNLPFSGVVGWSPLGMFDDVPPTTELDGDYYWNVQGMGDGSPLVAGVPNALLEQAPHLYAHILGRFGGQGMGGNVEAGVGSFGSYIDATAGYKSWTTRTMPFGLAVSETADVMTVLSWLAASSLSFIYLNRFTDRFHFIPWSTSKAVDWFFTFTPREVNELAPECRAMPESSVATAVRLRYGWDGSGGGLKDEVAIAGNHSSGGQWYVGLRDENMTVVASVNDRINFASSGGTYVATLTPGAYLPAALAQHAQVTMNAADTTSPREHYCSYAGTVTLNHNDQIVIGDGATKLITLTPGTYTMEALATMTTTVLNAASSGWTVSYSRTTGKFTFSKASGTAQLQFGNLASGVARNGCILFGFPPTTLTGALTYTGTHFIEEQRFAFGAIDSIITLLWATGADGSEAAVPRTAASLFGFDSRFNGGRGTSRIHVGVCPKSNGETTAAAREVLYGIRREGTYEARCIYDGETAREMRNRIADLYGKPRMRIQFTTEHAPDLERGRVIAMSGDFDTVMPYPEPGTDGSWTGKRFVVVETEQNLGPLSYGTRIVAVSLG